MSEQEKCAPHTFFHAAQITMVAMVMGDDDDDDDDGCSLCLFIYFRSLIK